MTQLKLDTSINQVYDPRFQRLIDRIFTGYEFYSWKPEQPYEIKENQLKDVVALLIHVWDA